MSRLFNRRTFRACLILGMLGVSLHLVPVQVANGAEKMLAESEKRIGRKIDDFSLLDPRGASISLSDTKDKKLVVVAFLGTECPVAKACGAKLAKLANEYEAKGVVFAAIFSNQQDTLAAIGQFAKQQEIKFACLKDPGNVIADRFGALRTPDLFVLDAERVVRYWGRIDDEFQVGVKKAKPGRRDLAEALDELLSDKKVSVPTTSVAGCIIGRVTQPDETSSITYSKQVSRIFQNRCVDCHRSGEVAPFALTSYQDAAGWAETIAEVVKAQRMPPWGADPKYGTFRNDCRLSDDEKQTIYDWVKAGAPEGKASDLPTPKKYTEGWRISTPDQVVHISDKAFHVPAEGEVKYQYFTVDPGFKEDKWIQAAECRAGNREVVHHMLVYVKPPEAVGEKAKPFEGRPALTLAKREGDFPTDWLVAMAPGSRPLLLPTGLAKKIPAGSKLVFQMHYTPNGKAQDDRSYLGLVFADPETVKREVMTWKAANPKFLIPPGNSDYKVEADYKFSKDTVLLAMFPHMHLRGKAFQYEAIYPDGKTEILLNVPKYDFNWQNSYEYSGLKIMPAGTRLHCTAWFDNSKENLANPNPLAFVRWGDQTWDEMMIGYFAMTPVAEAPK